MEKAYRGVENTLKSVGAVADAIISVSESLAASSHKRRGLTGGGVSSSFIFYFLFFGDLCTPKKS